MSGVRAKKHLGQHFLTDRNIARKIAMSLEAQTYSSVLEIGPGTGILTSYLIERGFDELKLIEIDREAADYISREYKDVELIRGDFLGLDLDEHFTGQMGIIGNFPYNISSQIMFRVLKYRDKVYELAGMMQKEVAERIVSPPGSKVYGILSVLLQAYYNVEILFTVPPRVFRPPPKVQSAVIRLVRKEKQIRDYDEQLFFRLVKVSFNQRRKIIRNSLKPLVDMSGIDDKILTRRPEELDVVGFIELTRLVDEVINKNNNDHGRNN
ncbi:MAG: 16S rRNA (adenine(1518)-N(6)/adenine(1519)-N(6))-dimethyltransferase RsmA [Bacteroidales bacterium]|nr:16S rRNA (adenine(1518)-N(6)/adenine(1519)-N(6))-dimethyltransferase RsmA [Bacteroidales bacterium]